MEDKTILLKKALEQSKPKLDEKLGWIPYVGFRCLGYTYNRGAFINYQVMTVPNHRTAYVVEVDMYGTIIDHRKQRIYYNKEDGCWESDPAAYIYLGVATDEGIKFTSIDDPRLRLFSKTDYWQGHYLLPEPKLGLVVNFACEIHDSFHYPYVITKVNEDKTEIEIQEYKGTRIIKGKIWGDKPCYLSWVAEDYKGHVLYGTWYNKYCRLMQLGKIHPAIQDLPHDRF